MQPTHHSPRLYLAALVAVFAVALASCGGSDGPSVRAEPDTSTTSSTNPSDTTTTTAAVTTTTTSIPSTTLAGAGQVVTFGGISLRVPADWPVHELASDPTQCVRFDIHAAYLGQQGPNANCPAHLVGRTEAVQIEQLDSATQLDAAQATQPLTINGLNARSDPDPDSNGALTVVFPDQHVVVILAYGTGRAIAEQILATVATA